MQTPAERCSARSEIDGESMLGTASTVRRWLLVEHPGPWGRRPLLDARLPDGTGEALAALERELGIRTLLIRRVDGARSRSRTCFAIRSGPGASWIERTTLARVDDVFDLDLAALAAGRRPGLDPVDEPLFVVCTHGRHDPCCAERGRPVASALAGADADATWESTHVGGDRFAGNVVAFPHGWYFGRVVPGDAPRIASAYRDGRLDLEHARGRSCDPTDVQAAELALRLDRRIDGLDDVHPVRRVRDGDRRTVAFETPGGRAEVVVERAGAVPRPLTCHARHPRVPVAWRPVAVR